ncbi:hypothetical protein [Tomitella fengzijianii]|uniref:Low molecular weight antigen MTB12-like C-terminal domain-containing protein n=1 Tax=Tomitella fengzijianii TaxID=2597660 RepID=A0A516X2L7_9ACTN|nr:hypothetical protein [Tomitella fengzijianii]QDQ97280.1 hypothetical protein FO059_07970 [Tomitella fengzijianii]
MSNFCIRPRGTAVRSAGAAIGLCAVVVLTAAGCGSSGDSGSTAESSPPTTAAEHTTGAGAADSSGLTPQEQSDITSAYETFFSGKSDAQTKLGVIEDPDRFAKTINAQSSSGLAESTSVTVGQMSLVSPGRASVVYTILMDDKPVLPDQTGYAVEVDGKWKVSASSFCGLLTLENGGTPPAECAAQGGAPAGTGAPATPTS